MPDLLPSLDRDQKTRLSIYLMILAVIGLVGVGTLAVRAYQQGQDIQERIKVIERRIVVVEKGQSRTVVRRSGQQRQSAPTTSPAPRRGNTPTPATPKPPRTSTPTPPTPTPPTPTNPTPVVPTPLPPVVTPPPPGCATLVCQPAPGATPPISVGPICTPLLCVDANGVLRPVLGPLGL